MLGSEEAATTFSFIWLGSPSDASSNAWAMALHDKEGPGHKKTVKVAGAAGQAGWPDQGATMLLALLSSRGPAGWRQRAHVSGSWNSSASPSEVPTWLPWKGRATAEPFCVVPSVANSWAE